MAKIFEFVSQRGILSSGNQPLWRLKWLERNSFLPYVSSYTATGTATPRERTSVAIQTASFCSFLSMKTKGERRQQYVCLWQNKGLLKRQPQFLRPLTHPVYFFGKDLDGARAASQLMIA